MAVPTRQCHAVAMKTYDVSKTNIVNNGRCGVVWKDRRQSMKLLVDFTHQTNRGETAVQTMTAPTMTMKPALTIQSTEKPLVSLNYCICAYHLHYGVVWFY